jgi:urea ABC transporter ATP-binding protein UrtD
LLLETADLGVRFGGVWALHDFNLKIEEGEIHGFIGPNGSGKSTLFNLIDGRYKPTTGQVTYGGRSLKGLSPDDRARLGITVKFQITSVFAGLTVAENIRLGLLGPRRVLGTLRSGKRSREDEERAAELLSTIGLWDKRDEVAGTLAHGEKGWLEIGMALATEPQLLLLDEPASGMGREETAKTVDLIKRVRRGRTILVIEHDMEFVRAVAERITVLFRGGFLTEGSYDEVKADERVVDAYLGRGREHGLSDH